MHKQTLLLAVFAVFVVLADDCSNWNGQNACQGQQTDNPPDWILRQFQTPKYDDALYEPAYQDMYYLVAYPSVKYSADKTQATVTIISRVNTVKLQNVTYTVYYSYNGGAVTTSNTYLATQQQNVAPLYVKIMMINHDLGRVPTLYLDAVDFVWNNVPVNQPSQYEKGQKGMFWNGVTFFARCHCGNVWLALCRYCSRM